MKKVIIQLDTLTCPSCTVKIEALLKKTKGVKYPEVLFNSSRIKFEFEEDIVKIEDIETSLDKLGFDVLNTKVK